MKRTYFPGIVDTVVVVDPAEIRTISNDPRFDREFTGHGPVRNVQLLRKMLRIFSLNGRLFPPMLPRADPGRAATQDQLWSKLSVKAEEVKRGPAQLEPLAEWVRGIGTAEKLDLLVQQSIGRLFVEAFTATAESLAAAHMVLEAATSSNVLKMLEWRMSGRLEQGKTRLASMVNGDLAGVVAMITARQLITDGLHKMRQLAVDPALQSSITTDAVVELIARLCPTMLPYIIGTPAAFDFASFNGRALGDDVVNVILTLASNTALGDGVGPDKARIRSEFPYFAEPHTHAEQADVIPAPQHSENRRNERSAMARCNPRQNEASQNRP